MEKTMDKAIITVVGKDTVGGCIGRKNRRFNQMPARRNF